MKFHDGEIDGVKIIKLSQYKDERGWLAEIFRSDELSKELHPKMAYISMTRPKTLRGPHEHIHQTDYFCFCTDAHFKLMLWDNRKESPTYNCRSVIDCGNDNRCVVIVPPGVVHGYYNNSELEGMVINTPNALYRGDEKKEEVDEVRHEADENSPFLKDAREIIKAKKFNPPAPPLIKGVGGIFNLLVTGSAGFIGSNFVRHVLEKHPDLNVISIDKLTYAANPKNMEELANESRHHFYKGDIADAKFVGEIFLKHEVDAVVNFAAESHVDRSILDASEFITTNVQGTLTLLEAARKAWKDFEGKRFLHISTDEVYGSLGKEGLFTEKSPIQPNSPYAASKASADMIARSFYKTYGFPVLVTRASNNYGPRQFPEKLIPLTLINIMNKKAIPIYGDGKQVRDWLFVKDHCEALDVVLRNGKIGEVYNIGGMAEEENITTVKMLCTVADELLENTKGTSENLLTHVKDRPGHDRRYALDITKIKTDLNWLPSTQFKSGLNDTVRWYLENQSWWKPLLNRSYDEYYQKQYIGRHREPEAPYNSLRGEGHGDPES